MIFYKSINIKRPKNKKKHWDQKKTKKNIETKKKKKKYWDQKNKKKHWDTKKWRVALLIVDTSQTVLTGMVRLCRKNNVKNTKSVLVT